MLKDLKSACKICEEFLQVRSIEEKQALCIKNFYELQCNLREYKMVNCFEDFMHEIYKDFIFLGIYTAGTEDDIGKMLNGIVQGNRFGAVYSNFLQSSEDQCVNIVQIIVALAGNDLALLDKIMPYSLGTASHGYFYAHYNMILALLNKDYEMGKEAKRQLEKFMTKKQCKFDVCFSFYLIKLFERDIESCSKYLQEMCDTITKTNWVQTRIFESVSYAKLGKTVALFVHGLYHLAYFYLEKEDFNMIKMPQHKAFIKNYEEFNIQHDFPKGGTLIDFSTQNKLLSYLTDITIIPQIAVNEVRNEQYHDSKLFVRQLLRNLRMVGVIDFEEKGEDYDFKNWG